MRVFVTGTGRCGTSTFTQAVRHATNFTAGHETRIGNRSIGVLDYPDQHIEVSPHLAFFIPLLRQQHPDARWVHLIRERESCIRSLESQVPDVLRNWAWDWFEASPGDDLRKTAEALYDSMNALISALLPDAFVIRLETAAEQWPDCWRFMGCEGDFSASRQEWLRAYNHGSNRGFENFTELGTQ